jgi:hypothetical protein
MGKQLKFTKENNSTLHDIGVKSKLDDFPIFLIDPHKIKSPFGLHEL